MTEIERPQKRVGVEVEFTGLSSQAAAGALEKALGGIVLSEDAHAYEVRGSAIGEIWVELDIRHAHPQRHGAALSIRPSRSLSGLFGTIVSPFVPCEMILPPRPVDKLPEVDRAIEVLRRAGAKGDARSFVGTLGLHFNIDAPADDLASLRATALAFARLDRRMRARVAENDARLAKRLAPPFSEAYVRLLEASSPNQSVGDFVETYLAFNPTRDRALDLLPLLLHIDAPSVRRRLPYEKISPRPVYHWRLPVARMKRPGWSIAEDWSAWLQVEAEAARILKNVE